MLLTISAAASPGFPDARDLGFLLHKHPDRVQAFEAGSATAYVLFPEATPARTTAALILVDQRIEEFVTDVHYVAGSQLAVAINSVFRTARAGTCSARPELPGLELDLVLTLPSVPCRGGLDLARRMFEPLGWQVCGTAVPLDATIPEWGDSAYLNLELRGSMRLSTALSQLYVLLPTLNNSKHYWVDSDEAEKLVRNGGTWLARHPDRDLIMRRYLAHRNQYIDAAQDRLQLLDDRPVITEADDLSPEAEDGAPTVPLVIHRHGAVLDAVREVGAHRVLDLGCGPGTLLRKLLAEPSITDVVGTDVSARSLEVAARRLHLERGDRRSERVTLLHSSLTYLDDRLKGYDAAVLMEVIEHLDAERLPALEHAVFANARPNAVIVTTPNFEYNVRYESLGNGEFRHPDHRFEWSRAEFADWAAAVADRFGYEYELRPVGSVDPEVGAPTQLALFRRADLSAGKGAQ